MLPAMSGVRFDLTGDQLKVTGTDYDLTIQVEVTVDGIDDGSCVVPSRRLSDLVRRLDPGAVTIEADDDDEVRITGGRNSTTLRALSVGEFPRLTDVAGDEVTLPASDLAEALRQVVRAASADDARPILTGVLLAAEPEGLRLVATDSYRLAVRDLPGATVLREGQKVLVPSRALSELGRLLSHAESVTLRLAEHDVSFTVGNVRLTTRLLEGDFPKYRDLIPQNYPNRLVVGRDALLNAARRMQVLISDTTTPVRIAQRPDGIELTVVSQDAGRSAEEVDAKYEGAEMTVAFNPTYLIDGIEAIVGDEIVLESVDALKPATLRSSEAPEYLYLLMPVRVS